MKPVATYQTSWLESTGACGSHFQLSAACIAARAKLMGLHFESATGSACALQVWEPGAMP